MLNFEFNHTHSVQVSLDAATRSLLERILPFVGSEQTPEPTKDVAHILPLVQELYSRARAKDGVSNPTVDTTIDPDSYTLFRRLIELLGSLSIQLYFPEHLGRPAILVQDKAEDPSVAESRLGSVICPGLFCVRTETYLADALVDVRVPVQQDAGHVGVAPLVEVQA